MALKKLVLKPGINKEGTNYSNEDGFYNCDKIRFRSGYAEKIGGWQNIGANTYDGVARSLWGWSSLSGEKLTGIGTSQKLYVEFGTKYYDITPLRNIVSAAGTITSTVWDVRTVSFDNDSYEITLDDADDANKFIYRFVLLLGPGVSSGTYVTAGAGNILTISQPTTNSGTGATAVLIEYAPTVNIATSTAHGATVGSFFTATRGYAQLYSDVTATESSIIKLKYTGIMPAQPNSTVAIDNEQITVEQITPSTGVSTRTSTWLTGATSLLLDMPTPIATVSGTIPLVNGTYISLTTNPSTLGLAIGNYVVGVYIQPATRISGFRSAVIGPTTYYYVDLTLPATNPGINAIWGNGKFYGPTFPTVFPGMQINTTGFATGLYFVSSVGYNAGTQQQILNLNIPMPAGGTGATLTLSGVIAFVGLTRGANNTTAAAHSKDAYVIDKTPIYLDTVNSLYDITSQDLQVVETPSPTNIITTLNVPTLDYYLINTSTTPIYLLFKQNAGASKYLATSGWGSMPFGTSTWGSSITTIENELRVWAQNNYDQDLIASYRYGSIYWWTKDTATFPVATTLNTQANAQVKTNTIASWTAGATSITVDDTTGINFGAIVKCEGNYIPEGTYVSPNWDQSNVVLLVLPTGFTSLAGPKTDYPVTFSYAGKHIPVKTLLTTVSSSNAFTIAFGATPYNPYEFSTEANFDPLLIRWSDQDNPFEWVPEVTNQSGEQRLSNGSEIITAVNTRQEILVWTDTALYSMQYLGPPYVFGINLLMDNLSIASQNAAITVNNVTYWMGSDRFYMYSGRVDTLPCTLRQFVFGRINKNQISQVICGSNEGFNEIWWFYPSENSTTNDSYVIFNHLENTWYYGGLTRTAWLDTQLNQYPIAAYSTDRRYIKSLFVSSDNYLYANDVSSLPPTGTLKTLGYLSINSQYVFCDVLLNYVIADYDSNVLQITSRFNLTYNSASYDYYCDHEPYSTLLDYRPNQLMFHEIGYDDNSYPVTLPIPAYVESSDFDIEDGLNFAYVWRIIPDLTFSGSTVSDPKCQLTVIVRQNSGAAYTPHSTDTRTVARGDTYPVEQYTGQVYCRVRGRQMGFRMASEDVGVFWQMGMMRIDVKPDGRR